MQKRVLVLEMSSTALDVGANISLHRVPKTLETNLESTVELLDWITENKTARILIHHSKKKSDTTMSEQINLLKYYNQQFKLNETNNCLVVCQNRKIRKLIRTLYKDLAIKPFKILTNPSKSKLID